MMKQLIALLLLSFTLSCSHRICAGISSRTIGANVTWIGIATNYKIGAFLAGPDIFVDLPETHWPSEVIGKSIEVHGVVAEKHDLPVFIPNPNEPIPQGIAVPPGTDLNEASKRFILERVTWRITQ